MTDVGFMAHLIWFLFVASTAAASTGVGKRNQGTRPEKLPTQQQRSLLAASSVDAPADCLAAGRKILS
jgi:hypothetical protein